MNPVNLYEAYSAVYNEDLKEDLLNVEEDFAFIDDLSDNELDQVMEEILSEGVQLSECFEAFDEVLTEARVDMSARAKARKEYMASSEKAAKEARGRAAEKEKKERRAERVERIKSSAKRAAERVGTTAAGAASAVAGGAAEVGRKAKAGAEKVKGKLASAKEKIKGLIKSGREAAAGGLRGLAAKVEPKEEPKADRKPQPYRGAGAGTKETVGKQVKTAAKEAINKTTTYRGQGVGRKEAASSGGIQSKTRSGGGEGPSSTGRALPPVGAGTRTPSGKPRPESQRILAMSRARKQGKKRLGEDFDLLAEIILEDLINEGYAETFEGAFEVLESFSDYEVGQIAENYLVEEREDLFDTILEYLVTEGYADTEEGATVIMANMSEEWRNEILENL